MLELKLPESYFQINMIKLVEIYFKTETKKNSPNYQKVKQLKLNKTNCNYANNQNVIGNDKKIYI